jgi:hypothetical protein
MRLHVILWRELTGNVATIDAAPIGVKYSPCRVFALQSPRWYTPPNFTLLKGTVPQGELLLMLQVETVEGVKNGVADGAPEHEAAIQTVLKACLARTCPARLPSTPKTSHNG